MFTLISSWLGSCFSDTSSLHREGRKQKELVPAAFFFHVLRGRGVTVVDGSGHSRSPQTSHGKAFPSSSCLHSRTWPEAETQWVTVVGLPNKIREVNHFGELDGQRVIWS